MRIALMIEGQEDVTWEDWGPFSFSGKHYTLTDLDAQPKPVQRPHPPLILGGAAGPRAARLAARYADGGVSDAQR